jgi:hypothetical protein
MAVDDERFAVISYVIEGGTGGILPKKILYSSTPTTAFRAFGGGGNMGAGWGGCNMGAGWGGGNMWAGGLSPVI